MELQALLGVLGQAESRQAPAAREHSSNSAQAAQPPELVPGFCP